MGEGGVAMDGRCGRREVRWGAGGESGWKAG